MDETSLHDSIRIDAPAERVWAMVSDVRRIADWSPQVDSTRLRSGFDTVELGTQFTNRNSAGDVVWTTHAEVVRFRAPDEIAFRVEENWVIWSFALTPDGDGVVLDQRRETPDGISDVARGWVEEHLGGLQSFGASMRAGMRSTLERIKAEAETTA